MSLDEIINLKPKEKKRKLSVTVDPGVLDRAKRIAESRGVKLSQVVDALLRAWVEEQEKLL